MIDGSVINMENRWAVVLAGGDGTRCRDYWRTINGDDRPTQFCSMGGERTLLQRTLKRARMYAPPSQTVLVTCQHQQRWRPQWAQRGVKELVQPHNADTGPAVLWALLEVERLCPDAVVAVFPSNQSVSDDLRLLSVLRSGVLWVEQSQNEMLALAAEARAPDLDHGWLLPDHRATPGAFGTRRALLVERPNRREAKRLFRSGAYWNTGILSARVATLLNLFELLEPRWARALMDARTPDQLERAYLELQPFDFCESVVQRGGACLSMLPLQRVAWSSLSTPTRIEGERRRTPARPHALVLRDAGVRLRKASGRV